jgi:transcriptional regulator with PAS, ATPase and Fis domain
MTYVRHRIEAEDALNSRPLSRLVHCRTVEDVLAGLSRIALEKGIGLSGIRLQQADRAKEIRSSKFRIDIRDVEIKVEVDDTQLTLRIQGPVNDGVVREIEDVAYMAAQRIELLAFTRRGHQSVGKGREAATAIDGFVGNSELVHELEKAVANAANSDLPVLVTGESGVGKELIARGIHRRSRRAKGPFIAVNCGALPETLIESELFGHEKGAFTGAAGPRKGKFELANGGTIFLDEIGELSLQSQVKLLRVLQERAFERLGGTHLLGSDVRIIAATNRDLEAMIKEGGFREDLYYRIKGRLLKTPALRDRLEDIPLLVEHFLNVTHRQQGHRFRVVVNQAAMKLFRQYQWPGNVRELELMIESLAEDAGDGGVITYEDAQRAISPKTATEHSSEEIVYTCVFREGESLIKHLHQMAVDVYGMALKRCGNHSAAARWLDIERTALYKLLKRAKKIINRL